MAKILFFRKFKYLFILLLLSSEVIMAQQKEDPVKEKAIQLLDSLWENPTSFFNINDNNWRALCKNLDNVDINNLNKISQSIFYGENARILNYADASEGVLGMMNK